jgi:50S ribosomal protein 6
VTRVVSFHRRAPLSRPNSARDENRSRRQHRASDRNRKKVEYPEIKAEEVPPLMTIVSEK